MIGVHPQNQKTYSFQSLLDIEIRSLNTFPLSQGFSIISSKTHQCHYQRKIRVKSQTKILSQVFPINFILLMSFRQMELLMMNLSKAQQSWDKTAKLILKTYKILTQLMTKKFKTWWASLTKTIKRPTAYLVLQMDLQERNPIQLDTWKGLKKLIHDFVNSKL